MGRIGLRRREQTETGGGDIILYYRHYYYRTLLYASSLPETQRIIKILFQNIFLTFLYRHLAAVRVPL